VRCQHPQAIVREYLPARAARALATVILVANHPGDPADPGTWPGWARMLPHVLALGPTAASTTGLLRLADEAAWYLLRRGDTRGGYDLARRVYDATRNRLGPHDEHTITAMDTLTDALRQPGRFDEARQLDKDHLARERRRRGADHPSTLTAAYNLALDLRALGETQAARELEADTLARCRRVLGEGHPVTVTTARNLAEDERVPGGAPDR
jgi:hypothetical protein